MRRNLILICGKSMISLQGVLQPKKKKRQCWITSGSQPGVGNPANAHNYLCNLQNQCRFQINWTRTLGPGPGDYNFEKLRRSGWSSARLRSRNNSSWTAAVIWCGGVCLPLLDCWSSAENLGKLLNLFVSQFTRCVKWGYVSAHL